MTSTPTLHSCWLGWGLANVLPSLAYSCSPFSLLLYAFVFQVGFCVLFAQGWPQTKIL
jgi:hypothetical protein